MVSGGGGSTSDNIDRSFAVHNFCPKSSHLTRYLLHGNVCMFHRFKDHLGWNWWVACPACPACPLFLGPSWQQRIASNEMLKTGGVYCNLAAIKSTGKILTVVLVGLKVLWYSYISIFGYGRDEEAVRTTWLLGFLVCWLFGEEVKEIVCGSFVRLSSTTGPCLGLWFPTSLGTSICFAYQLLKRIKLAGWFPSVKPCKSNRPCQGCDMLRHEFVSSLHLSSATLPCGDW